MSEVAGHMAPHAGAHCLESRSQASGAIRSARWKIWSAPGAISAPAAS